MAPSAGFFQNMIAAASKAAESTKYANSFIPAIYWDSRPVAEVPNTGLVVNIPTVDEGKVGDIGSGPIAPSDVESAPVTIPYDKHFSTSFVIKTFDQKRTPASLRTVFFQPRFEAISRKINRTIVNLITTANFPTYSLTTGANTGSFARKDISTAWANLVNAGVPVEDTDNLFFLMSPNAFANTLADGNFNNAYVVGQDEARDAQQLAKLQLILGAKPKFDQAFGQQPFNTGHEPGVLMHRYAISAVTSPPPPTDPGMAQIEEQLFWIAGVIPVQVQAQYSLKDQGVVVHIHCMWGVAVTRPDFASVVQTN